MLKKISIFVLVFTKISFSSCAYYESHYILYSDDSLHLTYKRERHYSSYVYPKAENLTTGNYLVLNSKKDPSIIAAFKIYPDKKIHGEIIWMHYRYKYYFFKRLKEIDVRVYIDSNKGSRIFLYDDSPLNKKQYLKYIRVYNKRLKHLNPKDGCVQRIFPKVRLLNFIWYDCIKNNAY